MNKPTPTTRAWTRQTAHLLVIAGLCLLAVACNALSFAEGETVTKEPVIHVRKCDDFEVTGHGESPQWECVQWVQLHQRPGGVQNYPTQFKMLYSEKGIYVLFDGADKTLTATMQEDFLDLWTEDVFECFFWTDERHPVYFEYEISPLGYELPILIPNLDGKFLGWRPWHYEGDRKTRKAVVALDGPREPHAQVSGWRAEVFFPYDLLKPLGNVPPKPATQWRANFYRVDYDGGHATGWDWARVGPSFHEFRNFGTVVFE